MQKRDVLLFLTSQSACISSVSESTPLFMNTYKLFRELYVEDYIVGLSL